MKRSRFTESQIVAVLKEGKVGVAGWWRAVLPARVAAQLFATSVTDIERRVGDDEIGFQVFVRIVQE